MVRYHCENVLLNNDCVQVVEVILNSCHVLHRTANRQRTTTKPLLLNVFHYDDFHLSFFFINEEKKREKKNSILNKYYAR